MKQYDQFYIGGQWVDAVSGRTIEVRNPSTDELIASVPEGGAEDVTRAVDAAAATSRFPLRPGARRKSSGFWAQPMAIWGLPPSPMCGGSISPR